MPFASASVPRHLLRGLIGLLALAGALTGPAVAGPAALVLLVVTVAAWRGCPTCWTVGLLATIDRDRDCRPCQRPDVVH
jgi:hypothetical protein